MHGVEYCPHRLWLYALVHYLTKVSSIELGRDFSCPLFTSHVHPELCGDIQVELGALLGYPCGSGIFSLNKRALLSLGARKPITSPGSHPIVDSPTKLHFHRPTATSPVFICSGLEADPTRAHIYSSN